MKALIFFMVKLKSIKDEEFLLIVYILVLNETNFPFLTHQFS